MVRVSLEHMILAVSAPRSTDWSNGPFIQIVLQINILTINLRKLLKSRK